MKRTLFDEFGDAYTVEIDPPDEGWRREIWIVVALLMALAFSFAWMIAR